jgi:hypothetical protein
MLPAWAAVPDPDYSQPRSTIGRNGAAAAFARHAVFSAHVGNVIRLAASE